MKDLVANLRRLDERDAQGAQGLLRQIVDAAPRSVDARLLQAQFHNRSGDLASAALEYEAAARLSVNPSGILCLLGATYNAMHRSDLALGAYRRAMNETGDARASSMAVATLHRLGRIQEALEIGHRALLKTPRADLERWALIRALTRLLRDGGAPLAAERLQQDLLLEFQSNAPNLAVWLLNRDADTSFPDWRTYNSLARLTRTLAKYSREASAALAFPDSFLLPADRERLTAYAAACPDACFVARPAMGPARTLALTANLADLADGCDVVVQRRLDAPLLIRGRRSELRVFVLVTSANPRRAYIHREGLAYFAAAPHAPRATDPVPYITSAELTPPHSAVRDDMCLLSDYWRQLEAPGQRIPIWTRIRSLVTHFLRSVAGEDLFVRQSRLPARAFAPKLFAIDLTLDSGGQPWLTAFRDDVRRDHALELALHETIATNVFAMTSFCMLDDQLPPDTLCALIKDRAALREREAAVETTLRGEFEPL